MTRIDVKSFCLTTQFLLARKALAICDQAESLAGKTPASARARNSAQGIYLHLRKKGFAQDVRPVQILFSGYFIQGL